MKSLPNSLLKAGYVSVKEDKTRVIDSNQMILDRINALNLALENEASEGDFADDFTEGLDAEQVEALLADRDEEGLNEEEMAATRADAEKIISEAREEADQILANANAMAEEIVSKANEEAALIQTQAHDDGFHQGESDGYQEGLRKANELEQKLKIRAEEMQREYEANIAQLEPRFVEVLTGIYDHVFNVKLSSDRNIILYLLKDAIRNIEGGRNFLVHVSAGDFSFVSERREELNALIGVNSTLELIEDVTLAANECFVEAESGIFDCSLGTELEMLKKELKLLSYSEVHSSASE